MKYNNSLPRRGDERDESVRLGYAPYNIVSTHWLQCGPIAPISQVVLNQPPNWGSDGSGGLGLVLMHDAFPHTEH